MMYLTYVTHHLSYLAIIIHILLCDLYRCNIYVKATNNIMFKHKTKSWPFAFGSSERKSIWNPYI